MLLSGRVLTAKRALFYNPETTLKGQLFKEATKPMWTMYVKTNEMEIWGVCLDVTVQA